MKPTRCSKCGRVLTNPESIARGLGPECAGTTRKGRHPRIHFRNFRHGKPYTVSLESTQIPLLPVFRPERDEPLEKEHAHALPA